VVDLVTPPPVPVMVIGKVPVGALLDTVSVKCDVPEPVIDAGLKLPVTSVGMPVADSATGESNPPETARVTTAYPLCPRSREPEVGETEMVKVPVAAAVTVRETVAVCVIPPPVPVMVMVDVPVAAVAATVKVKVDEPEPGVAMDVGLKAAVTPLGRPETDSTIAELNPPETAAVMVEVPVLPCATETDVGEAASVNAGTGAEVTVSEMVAVCVMLSPVPLTVMV
jgi:hypothetical protein